MVANSAVLTFESDFGHHGHGLDDGVIHVFRGMMAIAAWVAALVAATERRRRRRRRWIAVMLVLLLLLLLVVVIVVRTVTGGGADRSNAAQRQFAFILQMRLVNFECEAKHRCLEAVLAVDGFVLPDVVGVSLHVVNC